MTDQTTASKAPVPAARGDEPDLDYIEPTIGKVYRILSPANGKYLTGGLIESAETAFHYVFFCTDPTTSKYMISNVRRTEEPTHPGRLLVRTHNGRDQVDPDIAALLPEHLESRNDAIWQLEDAGNGSFRLWMPSAAKYAMVVGDGERYVGLGDKGEGDDLFKLEEVGAFPEVVALSRIKPPEFEAPKLKSYNPPPLYSDPQKCGEVAVPWFVVAQDGGKDDHWRAEHTPYYIIRRWSRWQSDKFDILKKTETRQRTWSVTWGVTKEKAQEIDRTMNMSVTAEAGFGFKGISASVSSTVSYGLSVRTSEKWSESYSKQDGGSYQIGPYANADMAVCDFYRQDVYYLHRSEGQEIYQFPVTFPNSRVGRTYTDK
ncbi:hypothetical protein J0910_22035 [Nocardiopsis sp. CNT-189]|uniref:hypothetical protein n=1 Tax=Nocardiopsis oceanisediminis TaxID=2816862 RepID=UPI003B2BAF40